jgi:hypothetical protein
VTGERRDSGWLIVVIRVPAEPSRYRVGVWRELRKAGAVSLGQGVWAVPDLPAFAAGVERAVELSRLAEGEATVLEAAGRNPADAARLQSLFNAARQADWAEFMADCGKFEAEVAKEIRIQKFTLAELEEEEQSLERLRRWHRDLTVRDVFGTPEGGTATVRLKECAAICEDFAERVFRALRESPGGEG